MGSVAASAAALLLPPLNVGVTGQKQQSTVIALHRTLYVASLLTLHGNLQGCLNTHFSQFLSKNLIRNLLLVGFSFALVSQYKHSSETTSRFGVLRTL